MPPTTPNAVSQVTTRAKTAAPLTLDVFNKTMAERQKTQIETLDQCKQICESQSSKFTEQKESINHLSTQVAELKLDNDNLRENISNLNKRIQDLETLKWQTVVALLLRLALSLAFFMRSPNVSDALEMSFVD
jgi:septal ring factor EnvC (AmiA/AmiB activator)